MTVDDPSILDWNVTVSSIDRILTLPPIIPTLFISDNSCNEGITQSMDFSRFTNLNKLVIGSNAFNNLDVFELINLPSLSEFKVGSNSLQQTVGLIAQSLPSLRIIEIGDHSFQSSSVFAIDDSLEALEGLSIGNGCFQGNVSSVSDLDIASPSLHFDLHSSPMLNELYLGLDSFPFFQQFNINGKFYKCSLKKSLELWLGCSNLAIALLGNSVPSYNFSHSLFGEVSTLSISSMMLLFGQWQT